VDTLQLIESLCAANRRLAEALGDPVPKWTADISDQADHAIEGEIYRSPDGQWTRIDFDNVDWDCRNTPNPAHIIMVLRRFHVLGPLESGYRATGDERYARAARRYIEAFLRDDPPVENWAPKPLDGATQYDIRIGVWLTALSEFQQSQAFDEAFMAQVLQAARVMTRYLTTHVWPDRNIRFWHGLVLLKTGLRLAGLPESAAWRRQGLAIVNDAVRRQLLGDGAHMEAAPGYHQCILEVVHDAWRLGRAMPELGLRVPTERLAAMHDYQLCATRPDGAGISLHDSRYQPAVMKPQTAVRDARNAFRRDAGLPEQLPETSAWYPDAGQVFIREDWTAESSYLTFDAATRRSFHWHPCRNSITLFAHGRALLVDPGYTFETEAFPRYGHRTAHHNTVNFNGWDQSQCPATLRADSAAGYTLVEGLYAGGYFPVENAVHDPGLYGEHHRVLLWIHGRLGVVLDHVNHAGAEGDKPTIESCWQLSEGPADCDPSRREVVTRHEKGNLLMQFPLVLDGTEMSLHEGQRDPMRGWLPIDWGRLCIPAPLLRVAAPSYDPWNGDMASVLIPFAGPTPPRIESKATGPEAVRDSRRAGCLRLDDEDGRRDLIVWTRRLAHAIEDQHGLVTDASLVHLRMNAAGAVEEGLMVDGTFCEFEDLDLMGRVTPLDRISSLVEAAAAKSPTGGANCAQPTRGRRPEATST